ncbi:discoidin domain-containing protein [Acidobacteriota bacterium]
MKKIVGFIRTEWLVLLILALVSIGMTYPLVIHMNDQVPSDLGDPLYSIWVMSWNKHAVQTDGLAIGNTNIFYPYQNTLYFADPLILLSAMNVIFLLMGANPVLSYNLLFLLSFFFTGLSMFMLVKYLSGSKMGGILAGIIYAFFPYRIAHISHIELLYFMWFPLILLNLHKYYERPRFKYMGFAGIFIILQALSCAYYAVYTALFAGGFILIFTYRCRLFRQWRFWMTLLVVASICFLIILPFYYPFVDTHQAMSFSRGMTEVKHYSAQPRDFLSVPSWNRVWSLVLRSHLDPEFLLFPGFSVLFLSLFWWFRFRSRNKREKKKRHSLFWWWDRINLLVLMGSIFLVWLFKGSLFLFGVRLIRIDNLRNPLIILALSLILRVFMDIRQKGPITRYVLFLFKAETSTPSTDFLQKFYLITAITAAILCMGPFITVGGNELFAGPYYVLFNWIPGFQGLRVPARFIILVMTALCVLSGWGVVKLKEAFGISWKKFIFPLILGILILLEYISIPIPMKEVKVGEKIPPIYSAVRDLPPDSALVEFPLPRIHEIPLYNARYMYYSIYHWKLMLNGYSGYTPPGYSILVESLENATVRQMMTILHRLDVKYILVHTEGYREQKGRNLVIRFRKFEDLVELVEQNQGDFLFRIRENAKLTLKRGRIPEGEGHVEIKTPEKLWRVEGSVNNHLSSLAIDGDLDTSWSTFGPQKIGDYFLLDVGREIRAVGIEFNLNGEPTEFPRSFRVEGSLDGDNWTVLRSYPSYFPDLFLSDITDNSKYKVDVQFDPVEIRYFRLVLTKDYERKNWSISEIQCGIVQKD